MKKSQTLTFQHLEAYSGLDKSRKPISSVAIYLHNAGHFAKYPKGTMNKSFDSQNQKCKGQPSSSPNA